jgi:hypothetical protein
MFVGPSGLFTPLEAPGRLPCLPSKGHSMRTHNTENTVFPYGTQPNTKQLQQNLTSTIKIKFGRPEEKTLAESLCYRSLLHLCLSLASSSSRTACILIRQAPFLSSPPSHDRKTPVPPAFVSSFHQMPRDTRSHPFGSLPSPILCSSLFG